MGVAGSKLEKALGEQFPEGERYFGFKTSATLVTVTVSCRTGRPVCVLFLHFTFVLPSVNMRRIS
uniref:Uncharacterized protein n=1 Tax=Brassica oleracea TaxID=3712 RepID=A0A3P6EU74_BRAOL|nr:unnamed protein product [Brassica oleracea]